MNTRKLTLTALLTAIALCIFTAEAQLPSLTAIPGIKLGLANVVTVFAMYALGPGATLCIVLVRVTLGCIAVSSPAHSPASADNSHMQGLQRAFR